jgi:myo-inositol-1(or 4)-monophosphatase
MLCASTGNGAWWNGKRAKVSAVDNLSKAYVCYTNIVNMARYGRSKEWERIASQAFTTRGWSDAYGYLLVGTGRAEVMLDPVMSIWDCAPFPVILKEAGGAFGSWSGVEGHNHGEAIATNQALFKTITQLINSQGS